MEKGNLFHKISLLYKTAKTAEGRVLKKHGDDTLKRKRDVSRERNLKSAAKPMNIGRRFAI